MNNFLKSTVLTIITSFAISQNAFADVTFNFDGFANGTSITTQYQTSGLTASGVTILDTTLSSSVVPHSGVNVAYAPSGLMNFAINSTITGNIGTVSAYLTGQANTGIYIYDSNGNLLGQSVLSAAASNVLVSVSSSTPIASIAIHDGGSTFAIDDLTLVNLVTAPTCDQVAVNLYDAVAALQDSDFKFPKQADKTRKGLLAEISYFRQLAANPKTSIKTLLGLLSCLQSEIQNCVSNSTKRAVLLNMINQLIQMTKAGQC